jgi:4-hydroxybutyryl-CoA dehydratase/vinylacetyl-CoA-Delta-isomerase
VITDPKGDRSRRAHEQDDPDLYVRIVRRTDEGIVVRGAKLHITAASLVHELVVMPTKGMRQDETDYAVSFSVPVKRQGREDHQPQLSPPELNAFDYPASATTACPKASWCSTTCSCPGTGCSWPARCSWPRVWPSRWAFGSAPAAWSLGGNARAVRRPGPAGHRDAGQGARRDRQNTIAELICYAEMLRMGLDYACRNFETTP